MCTNIASLDARCNFFYFVVLVKCFRLGQNFPFYLAWRKDAYKALLKPPGSGAGEKVYALGKFSMTFGRRRLDPILAHSTTTGGGGWAGKADLPGGGSGSCRSFMRGVGGRPQTFGRKKGTPQRSHGNLFWRSFLIRADFMPLIPNGGGGGP
jgi:hypothetical protein